MTAQATIRGLRESMELEANDCPTNSMERIQGRVLLGWIEVLKRVERELGKGP